MGRKIYLGCIIIYTLLSFIVQAVTGIRWIDAFTVFMLSGIFSQILDWKYGRDQEEDNGL
jgi:hypothetical protein